MNIVIESGGKKSEGILTRMFVQREGMSSGHIDQFSFGDVDRIAKAVVCCAPGHLF